MPFERETPFENPEDEIAAAREIIKDALPGWVLDERELPVEEFVSAAFVTPSLEAIREYYRQEAPPEWSNQVEERYRIYRVYPIYMVSRSDDPSYSRHAAVAYRLDENGVTSGRVYGFEA